MTKIYNISKKPTFDLQNIELTQFIEDEKLLLFRTKDIFHFNKVYWNITIRSRVIRPEKEEFKLVENIISAIIDAWYYGYLHWKVKLTNKWVELCKQVDNINDLVDNFINCQQLYLFQSLAWNYYDWTNNNPDLIPDITFTL